jgi:hypothetical protein
VKPEIVLAPRYDWKDETLVTLHSLSGKDAAPPTPGGWMSQNGITNIPCKISYTRKASREAGFAHPRRTHT